MDISSFTINYSHLVFILAGFFSAFIPALFISFTVYNRIIRQKSGLAIRLEQANRNLTRIEEEKKRLDNERQLLLAKQQQSIQNTATMQAELVATRTLMEERQKILEKTRIQMEKDFQLLSMQVMEQQGQQLTANHTANLSSILDPVKEQLLKFKGKVEEVYDKNSRDHAALCREIELLRNLNRQISSEARNLTRALQGKNKIQGQWGEMVLDKLLESSGLRKGHEFETQIALRDENGSLCRPDVLIRLPGGRDVVIDAKVSLTAWTKAAGEEDLEKQKEHLKLHLKSLHNHIHGLASKGYHRLPAITSLDFVILFIPTEPAFQAALIHEPDLPDKAMRKKIILAGPSTLLAILRTIHNLWRLDEQGKNSLIIAKQAGNLYDKFAGFLEAFEDVGFRLEQGQQSWQTARNRLLTGKGNLISRINNLKELGIQPQRELPDTIKKDLQRQ